MAPHAQVTANRFAPSSEHPFERSRQTDTSVSTHDAKNTFQNDSNSEFNDHQNPNQEPLCLHVERVVRQYFSMLGDEMPTDLYELILKEIERPLLSVVLEQTRGNQTKCAQILGLNRGTLRKKLKHYHLM